MVRRADVTLTVLVKNEEVLLGPLLGYIGPWVKEIVIVDTGSTDGTVRVAHQCGAAVVRADVHEAGFGEARNKGIVAASQPWVLVVDADEWPTMAMLSFIEWFTRDYCSDDFDAVYFTRENRIDGELLNDDRAYELTFRLMRSYMRYEGWLSEQMFTERSCEAPKNCLLLHHKTEERQRGQDAFYKDYAERHELDGEFVPEEA